MIGKENPNKGSYDTLSSTNTSKSCWNNLRLKLLHKLQSTKN